MISFIVKRPIAVSMITIALLIWSVQAILHLPVTLLPAISPNKVIIVNRFPGATAERIEVRINAPLREKLASLSGIENVQSQAFNSVGYVEVTFSFKTSIDQSIQEIYDIIDRLQVSLPTGAERPIVSRSSAANIPLLYLHVSSERFNSAVVSSFVQNDLRRQIEALEGVSLTDVSSVSDMQLWVQVDMEKIRMLELTPSQIAQAIKAANYNTTSFNIRDGVYSYSVVVEPSLKGLEELRKLPIAIPKSSALVALGDLADIVEVEKPKLGSHLVNGKEAVGIAVYAKSDAQTIQLSEKLSELVDALQVKHPAYSFDVSRNQGVLLQVSIANIKQSLWLGTLLVFILLFLFWGNWRFGLAIGLCIPITVSFSLLVMYLFGMSFNIITVGGMMLGIGMLIDNSIIVVDSILEEYQGSEKHPAEIVRGLQKVISPLLASNITTVVIFLPLMYLSGLGGALFTSQAITIATMLGCSLLVSFFLLPILMSWLFKTYKTGVRLDSSLIFNRVLSGYKASTNWVLSKPAVPILLVLLLTAGSIVCALNISVSSLPPVNRIASQVGIRWSERVNLNIQEKRIRAIQEQFSDKKLLSIADLGQTEYFLQGTAPYKNDVRLWLYFETSKAREDGEKELRSILESIDPGVKLDFTAPTTAFNLIFSTDQPTFEARLFGKGGIGNKDSLFIQLISIIQKEGGSIEQISGNQRELVEKVVLNQERLREWEFTEEEVLNQLNFYWGFHPTVYIQGKIDNQGVVLMPNINDEQTEEIYLTNPKGILVPLREIVDVQQHQLQTVFIADSNGLYSSLEWDTKPKKATIVALEDWAYRNGFTIKYTGRFIDSGATRKEIFGLLGVSLLLLYVVLSAQFESFLQPLVVLSPVPLAIAASLIGLFLFNQTINMMAGIGMVVVMGILVNDSILKLDATHRIYRENKETISLRSAALKAGTKRLRPILTTTLTTILAVLPSLFVEGLGNELQRPLVFVMLFGLLMATLSTLYLTLFLFRK